MEFEFDTEIFGRELPENPPLATHCDVALKYSKQRAALSIPAPGQYIGKFNRYKKEYNDIISIAGAANIKRLDLAHAQFYLLNNVKVPSNTLSQAEWQQQFRIAQELNHLNKEVLRSVCPFLKSQKSIPFGEKELAYLFQQYLLRSFYEEGVMSSGSKHYNPSQWWTKEGNVSHACIGKLRIFSTSNLTLIRIPIGDFLVSRDHLLILADLASQRYLLRLLSLTCGKELTNDFIPIKLLNEFLINGDLILYYGGNDAYKLVYMLEPLCISLLVGSIPVGWNRGSTFETVIKEESTSLASRLQVGKWNSERLRLLQSIRGSPSVVAQLFGLYRIWGHPTVEPLEGTSALKSITTTVRGLQPKFVNQLTNKFKEELIIRFISRYGKWPSIDVSSLSPRNVIRSSYEAHGVYPLHHPQYQRNSLELVQFNQLFPVDPKFDLIEMLADKAMSLNTPDLIEHLTSGRGVGSSIDRSVLIQWLQSPLHDPEAFLKTVDEIGFTVLEESVGLKEKEREGKIDARLFGLMTLVKRMYIVLTEALLSEHILPLFPEITMTDDELALDKKRLQFTDPTLAARSLYTSLDFSKWNSNMREAETRDLFQCFDQLFGFKNCFTRTHEMFKTSFMYLLNGSYLPQYIGGKFQTDLGSWTGHLGGIEGLRQKGWTIWTVILILLAAEDFPITLRLMGQGDNQILREIFPEDLSSEKQEEVHFLFLARLNFILSQIGPPLKMEETWTSRDLFVYGKYLIFKGTPLPMYGKRICRMFRLSNEDYPTMESAISSLSANLSAAYAYSMAPHNIYFLYLVELIGLFQLSLRSSYLQDNPPSTVLTTSTTFFIMVKDRPIIKTLPALLDPHHLQPDLLYMKLCLLPRCFGGYPIYHLIQACIRGFPDEVSFAISTLKIIYTHVSGPVQEFIEIALSPPFHPDKNYTLLFEHPTSLNLEVPSTPGEARRTTIIDFLKKSPRVKNPYLKEFLSILRTPQEQILLEYLATANPLAPRVLNIISSTLVEFRARQVAGKLQRTKTISHLARTEGVKNIYAVIRDSELNHLKSVLRLLVRKRKGPVEWNVLKCSLTHAQDLRNLSWQKEVIGVDCVPPQEFMILEDRPSDFECDINNELDKGHITIRFPASIPPHEFKDGLILGPTKPYRGSKTQQKVSGFGDKLATIADPIIAGVLRLFSLIGWCVPEGGNLAQLIKMIHESRTDLPASILAVHYGPGKGSHHHRQQDQRTGHGGTVPFLPNLASKFSFDTFPLTAYSKGSKNVNLMFQSLMSMSTVLLSQAFVEGWTPAFQAIHLHVKRSCCVNPINEEMIECPEIPPPCVFSYQHSPYLFVPASKLLALGVPITEFPVTLSPATTPLESTYRLTSALAAEIIRLLNPTSWVIPSKTTGPDKLVINWCLNVQVLPTLELVSFHLLTIFLPALWHENFSEATDKLALTVSRSSLSHWLHFDNLVFNPQILHALTSAPYYSSISGNPNLTPTIFAQNLKECVVAIIRYWSRHPDYFPPLFDYLVAPSTVLSSIHPSLSLLTLQWVSTPQDLPFPILRSLLLKQLDLQASVPLQSIDRLHLDILLPLMAKGRESIFPEDMDLLCKKVPELPPLTPPFVVTTAPLPSSIIVFHSFSRRNLTRSEFSILPAASRWRSVYVSHRARPLGAPTTGQYKCLGLIEHIRNKLTGNVMCVGDGSGGFTWSVLRQSQDLSVFYNTLTSGDCSIEQAPSIPFIPSLSGWPQYEGRVDQLELTNDGISDITNPNFPSFLAKSLKKTYVGLFCDAESENFLTSGVGVHLSLGVFRLALTLNLEWIVFKTYFARASLLRAQISLFLCIFQHVEILRSEFSDSGNTELYLYGHTPGKLLHSTFTETTYEGFAIPETTAALCKGWEDVIKFGTLSVPLDLVSQYTKVIHPDCDLKLESFLFQFLPFSDQSVILYPHSVLKQMVKSSQKHVRDPLSKRRILEFTSFSIEYLTKWTIAWITLWVYTCMPLEEELSELLVTGCLVWYSLVNGKWEFSLSLKAPPEEDQGRNCKVWLISSLLSGSNLKLIHRLVAVMTLKKIHVVQLSGGLTRGGKSHLGRKLSPQFLAISPWIQTHIQTVSDELEELPLTAPGRGTVLELWRQLQRKKRYTHK